jgi:hypothetical protein
MAEVLHGRHTAQIEGSFVVFLIGMRINKVWKIRQWLPAFMAMNGMLRSLFGDPQHGFLGARYGVMGRGPVLVQYWRSFDHLDRFAKDPQEPHLTAWRKFNREAARSGAAGIWHESYVVEAGAYECIYTNMPRVGLGRASELVPAAKLGHSALKRIGATDSDEVAVPIYDTDEG